MEGSEEEVRGGVGEEEGEGALGGFGHFVSCLRCCDVLGCRVGLVVSDGGRRGACVSGQQAGGLDGIEPVADIMRRIVLLVVIRTRNQDAIVDSPSSPVSSDELAMSRDETLSRDRIRVQPTSLQR